MMAFVIGLFIGFLIISPVIALVLAVGRLSQAREGAIAPRPVPRLRVGGLDGTY